jgi:hypothetical protein
LSSPPLKALAVPYRCLYLGRLLNSSSTAYFKHVHVVYPLLDQESFLACWEQLYDQPSSNRNVWMAIWLCLVVAIGAVCDNTDTQISRQAEQISKSLHEQVWTLTHRALHTSSIEAVQAVLLHVSPTKIIPTVLRHDTTLLCSPVANQLRQGHLSATSREKQCSLDSLRYGHPNLAGPRTSPEIPK